MEPSILDKSRVVLALRGHSVFHSTELEVDNFGEYARLVFSVCRDLTEKERAALGFSFREWAEEFRRLYDHWDTLVQADPMLQYIPKHSVAHNFHSSKAFVRYFMSGNGCSKTQSGYAEHYFVGTNQHKWRHFPHEQTSSFLVGLEFTTYGPNVFEKKMLYGEDNNYLSPMFPEGGKWLYRYDRKTHKIFIACQDCAERGRAGSCKHPKSTIQLLSDNQGWELLQGAQCVLGHFDEHVDEGWWQEAKQRLRVPYSSMIITGSPLFGMEAWEIRKLKSMIDGDPSENHVNPQDPESNPYVEIFNIDQYSAGILSVEQIETNKRDMDEFEIEARVYGRPSPLAKNPVFDRYKLARLRDLCVAPQCVRLTSRVPLEQLVDIDADLEAVYTTPSKDWTGVRVWETPIRGKTYIVAVDTAKGLTKRDASNATVLKLEVVNFLPKITKVAEFHGWLNLLDYADEVFKLAMWYGNALAVIETTGGYGEAVLLRLKDQLCYWNLYQRTAKDSQIKEAHPVQYGIDTNISTKPFMISLTQQALKNDQLVIWDIATISEMVAFEQEIIGATGASLTVPRYRGAGGAADDRVMSLVIGVSVALSSDLLSLMEHTSFQTVQKRTGFWAELDAELKAEANAEQELPTYGNRHGSSHDNLDF